jgi:hypothetical protein
MQKERSRNEDAANLLFCANRSVPYLFSMEMNFLSVLISHLFFNCRLLCVEHVEKNGKPILYLVFEFLDTDLKKFIDSHRRAPVQDRYLPM